MSERLDLTNKDNWTVENAVAIANLLGLPFDDQFVSMLETYIEKSVKSATVTDYLTTMAVREFNQLASQKKPKEVKV